MSEGIEGNNIFSRLLKFNNSGDAQRHVVLDMKNDPFEKVNVIDKYPKIAAKLRQFAEQHKSKFYGENKR